jgi:alpha-tubulin suppressor-like RCC1 family protein
VAWGYDIYHQADVPPDLTNAVVGIAGAFSNSAALKLTGELVSWGDYPGVPSRLNGSNVVALVAGGNHYLVLTGDGMVDGWAAPWGFRSYMPPEVAAATNLVAIAAGSGHNLALKSDGTVLAWGYGYFGQTNVPPGLSNVVAIAGGGYHSLALRSDGTVVAWGAGMTGTDSYYEHRQAMVPSGLSNVVAIAGGGYHSLALKADGTVVGWGAGVTNGGNWPDFGQAASGLSNVVAVACGAFHSLALKSDGTVVCWGTTFAGEPTQTNVPAGLSNGVAIASGPVSSACLALIGDGPPVLQVLLTRPTLSAAGFSISLPSHSGRVYRLEYKSSLADAGWTALPLAAGTRGTLTLVDTTAAQSQRFYRVRQW